LKLKNPVIGIAALSVVLMSAQALAPGLSSIMGAYNISEAAAALLITIPPLVMIPSTLLGASVLRYISKKNLSLLSILLITVAGVMPYFLTNFAIILVTRGFVGAGLGFLTCIGPGLSADYYPAGRARDRVTGIHGAFAGGGGLIYSIIGGWLCSIDVKAIFLVYLICLIPLLIVFLSLPASGAEIHSDKPSVQPETSFEAKESGTKKDSSIDPKIFVFSAQAWIFMVCSMTLMMNISQVVVGDGVGTTVDAGLITSLFSVGGFLVGFTFSHLVRFLKGHILTVGAVLSAAGLLLTALTRSIAIYCIASVIGGIGLNLFMTACVAAIGNKIRPEARNASFGIFMSINNLAQFISPIVIAAVSAPIGGDPRTKIIVSASILIVMSAVMFILSFRNKKAALRA
jgi:MFS family permease